MMYAVLCYNNEEMVCGWSREQDDAVMAALTKVHETWESSGKLKPSIRLLPTSAATTLHKQKDLVVDGPYAETKEALLGFYIIDVENLEEGLNFARELGRTNPGGAYELRPIQLYLPGAPISGAYAADREYAGEKTA
ncbi:MAG: YciI family protein [Sphingomonadales bacterium]|nr:MAG: YciI family protein [Sphingomonadales bacterium]